MTDSLGESESQTRMIPLVLYPEYLTNATAVTSGNYERYFIEDGVRYHHILDPKTGYSANNGLISTTIITENSMLADALSTATYVMGLEKAYAYIESLDDVEAIFITDDGTVVKHQELQTTHLRVYYEKECEIYHCRNSCCCSNCRFNCSLDFHYTNESK